MQARQKQVIESYQRVQDFLAANSLPGGASYGTPKELLDEVVARLTDHSTDQVAGGRLGRAETQRQKVLRTALRELHLRPIAKIAKATLAQAPGIDKALMAPAPQLSTTKLIAEANAIRTAVSDYEPTFVKHGRPAGFLQRLDAAIETLRQSFLGKGRNVGRKVGAKEGMKQEIQRGRDAVEMLDAMVTTAFVGQREVIARWKLAKRVQGIPGGGGPAATGGTAEENLPPTQPVAA